jgi:hypothetical protein
MQPMPSQQTEFKELFFKTQKLSFSMEHDAQNQDILSISISENGTESFKCSFEASEIKWLTANRIKKIGEAFESGGLNKVILLITSNELGQTDLLESILLGSNGSMLDLRKSALIQNVREHQFEYGFGRFLASKRAAIPFDPNTGKFVLIGISPHVDDSLWVGDRATDAALTYAALSKDLGEDDLRVEKISYESGLFALKLDDFRVVVESSGEAIDHSSFYSSLDQRYGEKSVVFSGADHAPYAPPFVISLDKAAHLKEFETDKGKYIMLGSVQSADIDPSGEDPPAIVRLQIEIYGQSKGQLCEGYAISSNLFCSLQSRLSYADVQKSIPWNLALNLKQPVKLSPLSDKKLRQEFADAFCLLYDAVMRGLDTVQTGRILIAGIEKKRLHPRSWWKD